MSDREVCRLPFDCHCRHCDPDDANWKAVADMHRERVTHWASQYHREYERANRAEATLARVREAAATLDELASAAAASGNLIGYHAFRAAAKRVRWALEDDTP